MTSEVGGRIVEIYVNPGDQVTQGQPLVRLDPTQLQSQQEAQAAGVQMAVSDVQSARTAIASAEANVLQAQQALEGAKVRLASARQAVVTAQTAVDREEVNLATAQREFKRTENLVESGIASKSEFDAARDRVDQAKVSLRTAQAQLDSAKIGIEEAKASVNEQTVNVTRAQKGVESAQAAAQSSASRVSMEQARLRGETNLREKSLKRAEITGVVADIPAKVGQYALANFSTTPLLTIADMSAINVEVNVDETEIDKVEVGQPVKVKVDALGEREIEGTVKQKTPLAVGKSDTQGGGIGNRVNVQEAKEFKVVVELDHGKIPDDLWNALKPGMTATAVITTKVKQNVVAVPLQAIVEKVPTPQPTAAPGVTVPAEEKPKPIKGVYVLDGNKVKFVAVETGITGESDIEIVSGLNAGDTVVTGPSRVLRTLKEGDVVKKSEKKPGQGEKPEETKS
jgi:HlyD family secretion protein